MKMKNQLLCEGDDCVIENTDELNDYLSTF